MREASDRATWWIAAYAGLVVALPLGLLVARGLAEGPGAAGAGELWLRAGGRSLALAGAVAGLACVGALPLARTAPAPVLFALFLISPLARALGVLGLGLAPGAAAVMLAQLAGALPLAALLVLLRLRGLDPRWLEAAADLGARPWTRLRRITLPLLGPTLATAALWSALVSVGDVATLELAGGGRFFSLGLLVREVALAREDVGALAGLVGVLVALTLPCARALVAESEPGVGAEGGRGAGRASVGLRAAGAAAAAVAVAPVLGLGRVAAGAGEGALLRGDLLPALEASLRGAPLVAGGAALAGFALALGRPRLRAGIGALVVAPLAIPPVAQGILTLELGRAVGVAPGELLTALGAWPASFALAYAAARQVLAGLPRALGEAARDLGAGPWARVRWVWAPLLARPAAAVALVLLALLLGAVDVPSFTSGPGGSTLAVALTIAARGGGGASVAAATLLLAAVPLAVVALAGRLARRGAP